MIFCDNFHPTKCRVLLLLLATTPITAFLSLPSFSFRWSLLLQATATTNPFPTGNPPFMAVITEPDACENEERFTETLAVLKAIQPHVDLISVRVAADRSDSQLVVRIIQELVVQSTNSNRGARIVVTSDWIEAAIQGRAHGIHVKESHRSQIPSIRQRFAQAGLPPPLIGTSAHSIQSAQQAWDQYSPNYMLVGTCYPTQTHPEKSVADLEGPQLPGQVAEALGHPSGCPVLAIGGINASNCAEPIQLGATGVATIRAVLQAQDPVQTVVAMRKAMTEVYEKEQNDVAS